MSELTKPTPADLENVAFCLSQMITWAAKCYRLGFDDIRAQDAEAARRAELALANGGATVQVCLNLTRGIADFALNLDDGSVDGLEIPLFHEGFEAPELSH
jgi:hypothetical protein